MPSDLVWLSSSAVVDQNDVVVRATGEPHALVHPDLLESAIERPRSHFIYGQVDDVLELATVLLFGIAQNHPFQQGNKRTALTAARAFMRMNGYDLEEHDEGSLAGDIIAVVEHRMTEIEFRFAHQAFIVSI